MRVKPADGDDGALRADVRSPGSVVGGSEYECGWVDFTGNEDYGFEAWEDDLGGGAAEDGAGSPSTVRGSMSSTRVPSGSQRFN